MSTFNDKNMVNNQPTTSLESGLPTVGSIVSDWVMVWKV